MSYVTLGRLTTNINVAKGFSKSPVATSASASSAVAQTAARDAEAAARAAGVAAQKAQQKAAPKKGPSEKASEAPSCKVQGLDTFYLFIRDLDNKLEFQRQQVNGNKKTKYREFFGHEKTVLENQQKADILWNGVRDALGEAVRLKKLPRMVGPYFIPFSLPEQLTDPRFSGQIKNLNEVKAFFQRISALSLMLTDKDYLERMLARKAGIQKNIVGGVEYPFGWVPSQLGFETGDWQKIAGAYYEAVIELAMRTCTLAPTKPPPITDAAREFGRQFEKMVKDNQVAVNVTLALLGMPLLIPIVNSPVVLEIIWDALAGAENLLVTTIERVRVRSGKTKRTIKGINLFGPAPEVTLDMRASYGQPLNKTFAQFIALFATEWFALHDELIRVMFGVGPGTKGPLGSYTHSRGFGEAATAAAATAGVITLEGVTSVVTAVGGAVAAISALIGHFQTTEQAKIAASQSAQAGQAALELAQIEQQARESEAAAAQAAAEADRLRAQVAAAEAGISTDGTLAEGGPLAQTAGSSKKMWYALGGAVLVGAILASRRKK